MGASLASCEQDIKKLENYVFWGHSVMFEQLDKIG